MRKFYSAMLILGLWLPVQCMAQTRTKLTFDLDQPGAMVSPKLYGLMTEEINYSYDGGVYGELVRNRSFKDNPARPDHWLLLDSMDGASIKLEDNHEINSALTTCLKFDVLQAGKGTALANDGYWGIPVRPGTTYNGSLYIKAGEGEEVPLAVSIESRDGRTSYATTQLHVAGSGWKKIPFTLTTATEVSPTSDAYLVIRPQKAGTYRFAMVSLFPPTYHNRPNGNRADLTAFLATMHPKFLRFPGGNYLEGGMFSHRFDWKKTLGPIEERAGHPGPWGYRSTDGLGLLEFLEWCEDLNMEPLLAVFAGYTLNKDYIEAGPLLQPFVEDALEEIEYVTGDTTTKWGKRRAMDGHPAPFVLHYVEVGNEDGFDLSGSYDGRFAQFYDGIKAKYPTLEVISTAGGKDWLGSRVPVTLRHPDLVDEHYYRNAQEMEMNASQYDTYERKGPKVFVGEWATREGSPTPNFNAALGDAAWMTGMERNSDLVVMSCYAPLLVNVNPGGMQWKSDLVGYDALTTYGSPSFYAQQLFNEYRGDRVVPIEAEGIPTQLQKLNHQDSLRGVQPQMYPSLFYVATRDSKTHTLFLKVVNASGSQRPIDLQLKGGVKVKGAGKVVMLKADHPEDTNTITEPKKIIPVSQSIKGVKKSFTYNFAPYSITILQLETL